MIQTGNLARNLKSNSFSFGTPVSLWSRWLLGFLSQCKYKKLKIIRYLDM